MSLYINHENQRILWESIQQHPSIDLIPQYDRNDWFKNIVKNVYETIPKPWFHRKITTEELNLLNQSTVRRMLGDLKPPMVSLPNQYQQPGNNTEKYGHNMSGQGTMIYPSYNEESMDVGIKSAHTPMIQQRYLEKQQELESMLRQPNPTTPVDFKMSTLDEPITNMEELLQKHAREREKDLALDPRVTTMTPLISMNVSDASASFQASSQNNIKINITEEPVTISIMDLVSDQTLPVIKKTSALKKHISFQDEDPLPNSSGSKATFEVSSEEAFSPLPKSSASEACFGLSSSVRSAPCPEFTYQIPEHVLLEQKILKLEQEMTVLKRLIFGIYRGMSVCPMQTLLLETVDGEKS